MRLKIEKEPDNPEKLRLNLNGESITNWFNRIFQEFQKTIASKSFKNKTNLGKKRGF